MSDWSLPPSLTLVFGRSGSGKTTFALRYLANAVTVQAANPSPAAAIFIFDWKLEASSRFGIPAITTEYGFEQALESRVVIFNPHPMFPGDRVITSPTGEKILNDQCAGLRWFCKRVFECCQRGPGKKIVYIDEPKESGVNKFCVPPEFGRIVRAGRSENLELVCSTQYPRDFHADVRGGVTEWICFNADEEAELECVRQYFAQVDRVKHFKPGQFIAYNRTSRAILQASLW
jgi:hypothetical protein